MSICLMQGMSALMWAARKDEQAEAVNKLISAGADMNLKNREVYSYL